MSLDDLLSAGIKDLKQEKEKVIANILNVSDLYTKEELNPMSLGLLEKLYDSFINNKEEAEEDIPEAPAVIMTNFNKSHDRLGRFSSGSGADKGTPASRLSEGTKQMKAGLIDIEDDKSLPRDVRDAAGNIRTRTSELGEVKGSTLIEKMLNIEDSKKFPKDLREDASIVRRHLVSNPPKTKVGDRIAHGDNHYRVEKIGDKSYFMRQMNGKGKGQLIEIPLKK